MSYIEHFSEAGFNYLALDHRMTSSMKIVRVVCVDKGFFLIPPISGWLSSWVENSWWWITCTTRTSSSATTPCWLCRSSWSTTGTDTFGALMMSCIQMLFWRALNVWAEPGFLKIQKQLRHVHTNESRPHTHSQVFFIYFAWLDVRWGWSWAETCW